MGRGQTRLWLHNGSRPSPGGHAPDPAAVDPSAAGMKQCNAKKPLLWFPFPLIIIFASLSILVLTQSPGKAEYYDHGHKEDEQLAKSQESSGGQESSTT